MAQVLALMPSSFESSYEEEEDFPSSPEMSDSDEDVHWYGSWKMGENRH